MVLSTRALVSLALAIAPAAVRAAVPAYGQCGGVNYTGETTCVSGYYCLYQNDFYSQCVPGTASTTTTAKTTSTSTTKASSSTSTTKATSTTTSKTTTATTATTTSPVPTSAFVKTSGQQFVLNGQKFTVVGSNAYWMAQLGSTADITSAFTDLKNSGITALRTWGFNEVTSPSGTYYQSWSGSTPTINTGADGLAKFDTVVAAAQVAGIKLIVALTNNWSDYGGMDVYTKQITGSANHDVFYTDTAVKTAFKNYINAFVTRYKTNTNIMAWELANEPRCGGSTGTTSGTCTPAIITAWIKEISAYIKSIDSNHLVAVGDEGFYNLPSNPSYPYQGHEGIDFDVNLAISTIDFGTAHAYPVSWGQTADPSGWGVQWIQDHATSQKAANKPVLLEEFGVTTDQQATYTAWYNAVVSSGLTGDLIWQAGSHLPSGSDTWNDGYAVFPGTALYTLQTQHAAALKARA